MREGSREAFLGFWARYFNDAELPIAFYYSDEEADVELYSPTKADGCLISNLAEVRRGRALRFGVDSISCAGGRRYTGLSDTLHEHFEYFLSCGIPGVLEGERYKKSPELVRELLERWPRFRAPKRYLVFKRWDQLEESDEPEVVVLFATSDVLSGLYTLANFDEVDENGVIAPFGSGCMSIVMYPYLEGSRERPRCVIGMFDPLARPHVEDNVLTFAVPMSKFSRMVENMHESFLITSTWDRIRERIGGSQGHDA